MLDPILSLVSGMQSDPGTYAVLAGSGVSRSARVPTGYEVMVDLIRRASVIQGVSCDPDPEVWFAKHFSTEPTYPALLDALTLTGTGRTQLLRSFFEATPDERARGEKTPTAAHLAIARLMERGFIRVVVTTNFDRLFEQAFESCGITPTVIATPDDIKGMRPLVHQRQLLIKVHGDYMDTRMKNTSSELASYDPALASLLARVFDEFGLIVCGWSGAYDTALRDLLESAPGLSFGTCWVSRGPLNPEATRLVAHRKAQVITANNADAFFTELAEKVIALAASSRPRALSNTIAIERLKTYLPNPVHRIALRELIEDAVTSTVGATSTDREALGREPTPELIAQQMLAYETAVQPLMLLFACGAYYGSVEHAGLWGDAIRRLAYRPERSAYTWWDQIVRYPAILVTYATGIGALAANNLETFRSVITARTFVDDRGELPTFARVHPWPIDGHMLSGLPGMDRKRDHARFSLHIHSVLKRELEPIIGDARRFQDAFDRLELYTSLLFTDFRERAGRSVYRPIGRWAYVQDPDDAQGVLGRTLREIEEQRSSWPLVAWGCFAGDFVKAREAVEALRTAIESMRFG